MIVVDADACPVKTEIVFIASHFEIDIVMVASYDHHITRIGQERIVQVDRSAESADMYIANHIQPGDVVVTQDFGLSALALGKRAIVITFRGQTLTDLSINFLLDSRYVNGKNRRSGKYGKGPKAFTAEDREAFQHCLTKVLSALQENDEV